MANVTQRIVDSKLLSCEMPYKIAVPELAGDQKLPTVYLLHGLFGSFENWFEFTRVADLVDQFSLIVVTPEGKDGWYTDSLQRFESFLTHELIPEVDAAFPTLASSKSRGIAGNSMGGYGALKIAVKKPDLFSAVAGVSSVTEAAERYASDGRFGWHDIGDSIDKTFGSMSKERILTNNLKVLFSVAQKMPHISLACGLDDGYLDENRRFTKYLASFDIDHYYNETDGGHDWDYWNNRIEEIMRFMCDKLSR